MLLDILTCAKALDFCDLLIPLTPTLPLPLLPKKITKLSCIKDNRKSGLPKSLHFLSVAGMHPIFIPKLWEYPFLYSQTFILLFFIYKFISGFVFVIGFVDESGTFSYGNVLVFCHSSCGFCFCFRFPFSVFFF